MVARRSEPVKPRPDRASARRHALLWAAVAACVIAGDSDGKRAPRGTEFTEVGTVSDDDLIRRPDDIETAFELGAEEQAACVEDLLRGHLGLGTAADVLFEGPAGVRVNLLSGNLVWHGAMLPHGSPRTRLALTLTYNAQRAPDPLAPPADLPPGWSHAHGARLRTGSWGVMEIVEDDGFVHRFYAAREGTPATRGQLIDDIVAARRAAGRTPGESLPRGAGFRAQLEDDPLFLAAMRSRFLGEGIGTAGRYVSEARGHQLLQIDDDGSAVRLRADQTVDRFDERGRLVAVLPAVGPAVEVRQGPHRLESAAMRMGPELTYDVDPAGRLERVAGAGGRAVTLLHEHGQLVGLDGAGGRWRFEYHAQHGRLVGVDGPDGWARVEYDPAGERVTALEGPGGRTTFRFEALAAALTGEARGPAGDVDVRLDTGTASRSVRGPDGVVEVRFDAGFNRPLVVGDVGLEYDMRGRIVRLATPGGELRVETDAGGAPTRIVGPDGGVVELEMADDHRLARAVRGSEAARWVHGFDGQLQREDGGGRSWTIRRNLWGEVETVGAAGGQATVLRRDEAGRVTSARGADGTSLRLRWDERDRLVDADVAGRFDARLHHHDRALRVVDGFGGELAFTRGDDGRVVAVERSGVRAQVTVERGDDGLLTALVDERGRRQAAMRAPGGALEALDGGSVGALRLEHGVDGLDGVRVAGTRWRFERGEADGRLTRVSGDAGHELRIERDAAGRLIGLSRGPRAGYVVGLDDGGRTAWVDPAQGAPVSVQRSGRGEVVQLHDGAAAVLKLAHDTAGRVTAVTGADGRGCRLVFDRDGGPSALTTPAGSWVLVHDGEGRVQAAHGPAGELLTLRWGPAGLPERIRGTGGFWLLRHDARGRLAELDATRGGLVGYQLGGGGVELTRGATVAAGVELDGSGRLLARRLGVDGDADAPRQSWERSAGGGLSAFTRDGVRATLLRDGRGRLTGVAGDDPGAADALTLGYGGDGLLDGWAARGEHPIDRDALGHPLDPTAGDGLALAFGGALGLAAGGGDPDDALGALATALLEPYLGPPWARGGGGGEVLPGAGALDGLTRAAPLPRWAIDRLWGETRAAWTAALPSPPGADLAVPGEAEWTALTVPGLLALLGFVPDDLGEHRQLACLPPPALSVPCPAVAELRALHALRAGTIDAVALPAVAVDPDGRGVALHPGGVIVGHPTPWAAIEDPLALWQPAAALLGVPPVPPAPAATVPPRRGWADADSLADGLRLALESVRWWSAAPTSPLAHRVALQRDTAGAFAIWTGGGVQAVVDDRGRLRGLDLGATATAAFDRRVTRAILARAADGDDPAPQHAGPVWLPLPGAPPEQALGLEPVFDRVWSDAWGEPRVVP